MQSENLKNLLLQALGFNSLTGIYLIGLILITIITHFLRKDKKKLLQSTLFCPHCHTRLDPMFLNKLSNWKAKLIWKNCKACNTEITFNKIPFLCLWWGFWLPIFDLILPNHVFFNHLTTWSSLTLVFIGLLKIELVINSSKKIKF